MMIRPSVRTPSQSRISILTLVARSMISGSALITFGPLAKVFSQLVEPVDDHIGFSQAQLLGGAKSERDRAGSSACAAPGVYVVLAIANYDRPGSRPTQQSHRFKNRPRIGL